MNAALQVPGLANGWTMPIKGRIEMLSTGSGFYLDVEWQREKLNRYGLTVAVAPVTLCLIALLGVESETGVFMLLYLDLAYEQARKEGRLKSLCDLQTAIRYGAVQRLRPKFMTVATTFLGLVPIMWSLGTGSDVMKRIAAPMIGGIFTSFLLEWLVYPGLYQVWKWHFELRPIELKREVNELCARAGQPPRSPEDFEKERR